MYSHEGVKHGQEIVIRALIPFFARKLLLMIAYISIAFSKSSAKQRQVKTENMVLNLFRLVLNISGLGGKGSPWWCHLGTPSVVRRQVHWSSARTRRPWGPGALHSLSPAPHLRRLYRGTPPKFQMETTIWCQIISWVPLQHSNYKYKTIG
jgi:hypothetical protein